MRCPEYGTKASSAYTNRKCRCETCQTWRVSYRAAHPSPKRAPKPKPVPKPVVVELPPPPDPTERLSIRAERRHAGLWAEADAAFRADALYAVLMAEMHRELVSA